MKHNAFVSTLAARFQNLDDLNVIKERVTRIPKPDRDIADIPEYLIKSYIGKLLSNLYIPTTQELALLRKLVHTASAHCELTYRCDQQYIERLYTHFEDFATTDSTPDIQTLICLTGPAGVGKSSVLHAMRRLLPAPTEVDLGARHGTICTHSHWHAQVHGRTTAAQLLESFSRTEHASADTKPKQIHSLSKKIAYKSGVSIFLLDELQFLTQSASANTAVTKFLFQLSHVGVPLVYAANYSLCRLLQRRHEQERQRLLASPVVLTASPPDSVDWSNYLRHLQSLLGSSLQVDLHQERYTVHRLTAGLKRLVVQLLKLGYALAWQAGQRHMALSDIRAAYDHTEYAVSRQQAEAMCSPHTSKSAEYECPFPLPKVAADELIRAQDLERSKQIMENIQREALLMSEREALKVAVPRTPKAAKPPKRPRVTGDSLRQANADRLNSRK